MFDNHFVCRLSISCYFIQVMYPLFLLAVHFFSIYYVNIAANLIQFKINFLSHTHIRTVHLRSLLLFPYLRYLKHWIFIILNRPSHVSLFWCALALSLNYFRKCSIWLWHSQRPTGKSFHGKLDMSMAIPGVPYWLFFAAVQFVQWFHLRVHLKLSSISLPVHN